MGALSSWEHGEQLLQRIDAVLDECGQAPTRRPLLSTPDRARWSGPSWLHDERPDGNGPGQAEHRRT